MIKIFFLQILTVVLATELFYTSDSYECKHTCIGQNKVFCPVANQTGGNCCENSQCNKVDYCSNDAAVNSVGLQLWSCPFETSMCGYDVVLVPNADGSSKTLSPSGNYKTWFVAGAICRYKLVFPLNAGQFDQIKIQVNNATRVQIYAVMTEKYDNPDATDLKLIQGDVLLVQYP